MLIFENTLRPEGRGGLWSLLGSMSEVPHVQIVNFLTLRSDYYEVRLPKLITSVLPGDKLHNIVYFGTL